MANNYYNNMLNCAQRNTGPNGCRLCNQVFISTDALVTHIESHMAQEEAAIRRLYALPPHDVNSQMQLGSHQYQSPPTMGDAGIFQAQPLSMVMPQPITRNPFFNAHFGSSSQPIKQMQIPPQPLSYAGNINDDDSKAYIMKLEKPIKKIDFIDLVNVDDDNKSEVKPLDLELKL